MNDKDLLKKLNNLKTIKPDDNFKKNYRELLYAQISAGATVNKSESNLRIIWESIMPGKVFINMVKPVWITSLASVLILVIGVGGVYASKNSKPGDSLYIAKIISEKAQFVMTFNEKDKAKLGLEFATNRAKEITQVLEESKESEDKKGAKVEQLSQDFKKEISQVKNRLTTIKKAENKNNQNKEEEPEVFGANLGKDDQRMEISEPVKPAAKQEILPEVKLELAAPVIATTTEGSLNSPDKALEEAEKMLDEKNYDGAIDKIEEAKQIINQESENLEPVKGEVKGVSETATSTN
ncbi:MAG: DUF5667 domain-containing protein [Patescibacteria group bacterium]|jgi:hypothetical protein